MNIRKIGLTIGSCGCFERFRFCSKCNELKSFDKFQIDKRKSLGIGAECKECKNLRSRKHYSGIDPEIIKIKGKEKRIRNAEKNKIYSKNRYYKDIEKSREKNRLFMRKKRLDPEQKRKDNERAKEYHKKNKDKITSKTVAKYHNDINFNLLTKLRQRTIKLLKRSNGIKSSPTKILLGRDLTEVRNLLIENFNKKYNKSLTFEEFLQKSGEIVVDHIIPCEAFDLVLPSAQKICFHYSNLQLLTVEDNDKKSDFLPNGTRAREMSIKYTGEELIFKLRDWRREIF